MICMLKYHVKFWFLFINIFIKQSCTVLQNTILKTFFVTNSEQEKKKSRFNDYAIYNDSEIHNEK